jgi:predicted lactoylglutathione lyase
MKPRINVLTLAVDDLAKAHRFYHEGLGLPGEIIGSEFKSDDKFAAGEVAFFELEGGLIFALYPRTSLAKDSNRPAGSPNAVEFSIGYAVGSKEKVDELLQLAEKAGATITEPPYERPWGIYSGYFQDLDGHLWEVIWNPGITIED